MSWYRKVINDHLAQLCLCAQQPNRNSDSGLKYKTWFDLSVSLMIWLLGTETELRQMIISFLYQDISAHSLIWIFLLGAVFLFQHLNSKSDLFCLHLLSV